MLEIFNFYISTVVNIFNNILNGFQVANGVGFGTFLLACSLLVVFINLLKFRFSSNGMSEIIKSRNKVDTVKVNYWNSSNPSYLKIRRGGR